MNRRYTNRDRIQRQRCYDQRTQEEIDLAGGIILAALCLEFCAFFWMWLQ